MTAARSGTDRAVRKVLLFSYHFPPIGGAGTQRPARFARYLPDSGWNVHVLTSPGTAEGRWTPRDDSLEAEVPPETMVTRVDGEPPPGSVRQERLERWLRVPTPWQRWWSKAAVEAGGSARDVSAIWTIMPPYESAKPSMDLARRLGVPWVADLGDPWALDEMTIYPSGLHRLAALREMRMALRSAGAIVMSTPEAALRARAAFPEICDRPVVAIPNGYDASDFDSPAPASTDGVFRIVHAGYLHTELGLDQHRGARLQSVLGGHVPGVNVLTRSHFYLVEAVERMLAETPGLAARLEMVFAGVLSDVDKAVARRLSVSRLPGYLPHSESVALIRSADMLFLPMQMLPDKMRATTVPGKTYEYLASGRPILAAVPEGDARDLVIASRTGLVCEPDDVAGMIAIISEQMSRDRTANVRTDVSRFEYRQLTRRVAAVLDEIVPGRPG
jgi:glycosyltransferase involved in cell wall biosynthesis